MVQKFVVLLDRCRVYDTFLQIRKNLDTWGLFLRLQLSFYKAGILLIFVMKWAFISDFRLGKYGDKLRNLNFRRTWSLNF